MRFLSNRLLVVLIALAALTATMAPVSAQSVGEGEDKPSDEETPWPVPDPRYDHDEFLPFESYPGFEDGALPADDQQISHHTAARGALGFSDSKEEIVEMLAQPWAQDVVAEYGMLLNPAEVDRFANAKEIEDVAIALVESLADTPGFLIVRIDRTSLVDVQGLTIRGKAESKDDLLRRASELTKDEIKVSFDPAPMDRAELTALAETATRTLDESRDDLHVSVDFANGGAVTVWYDEEPPTNRGDLGRMGVSVKRAEVEQDTGFDPCTTRGCNPRRGGIEVEGVASSTSVGTVGYAVTRSGNESWLVSGHINDGNPTSFESEFQLLNSTSYAAAAFFYNRDHFWGSVGASGFYDESRMDGVLINEGDWSISNRVRTTEGDGDRVSGSLSVGGYPEDLAICYTGTSTGFACGEVVATGLSITSESNSSIVFRQQVRTDVQAQGGDSGGPVYRSTDASVALGIVRSNSSVGMAYSPIQYLNYIQSGLSLYTFTDRRKDFVNRLFEGGLDRFSDSSGFNYWRNTGFAHCNLAHARNVARSIMISQEFRNRWPIDSASRRSIRVEIGYWAILGRPSDSGGLTFWRNYLGTYGENGWTTVVNSFVNGPEFTAQITGNGASSYDGKVC